MAEATEGKRCWIRLGGHEIEIRPGETLIGRHETCHIVIDDPLASRRHARLLWDQTRLVAEDLGSVNGVLLNGKRVEQSVEVVNGDELKLGNQRMDVFIASSDRNKVRRSLSANTLVGEKLDIPRNMQPDEATGVRDGEALSTLALVAERVLAMGRGAEAERILDKSLQTVRVKVQRGEAVDGETLELAANCAARLAEVTRKGVWVDYPIELHSRLGTIMPGPVVDKLYNAVRVVEGGNVEKLRSYIQVLTERRQGYSPGELFLLRRIEGLERLFALR